MNRRYSVNIDDLRDRHISKCNIRTKIYEKLLEKCYYRINNSAENDLTYCIYPIPDFVLGMPTYNLAYCAAYIIFDLRRNGFNGRFFNPNVIFVQWNYEQPSYLRREEITYTKPKMLMPPSSNTHKTIPTHPLKTIEIQTAPTLTSFSQINNKTQNKNTFNNQRKQPSDYRSINDYKPTGNFIYN